MKPICAKFIPLICETISQEFHNILTENKIQMHVPYAFEHWLFHDQKEHTINLRQTLMVVPLRLDSYRTDTVLAVKSRHK